MTGNVLIAISRSVEVSNRRLEYGFCGVMVLKMMMHDECIRVTTPLVEISHAVFELHLAFVW